MHLLENYALTVGAKIDRMYVKEEFFPLSFKDYITFSPVSKGAKTYQRWHFVMDLLGPLLDRHGVKIIQLGAKDEQGYNYCFHAMGNTSIAQCAYLVRNAKLHLSVDTFTAHLAGYFGTPLVCIYGNNHINNVRPYWGKPDKQVLIAPDRGDRLPCFSIDDPNRDIDRIMPENIVRTICGFLGVPFDYPYRTVWFGPITHARSVEAVPNVAVSLPSGLDSLLIRMDYLFDPKGLDTQLRVCPCQIVTDRPIDINLLRNYGKRVMRIFYEITENHDPTFVKSMSDAGVPFSMFSYLSEDWLQDIKLDYCDYGVIFRKDIRDPRNMDEFKGLDIKTLKFRSLKVIFSGGTTYPTKRHFIDGISITDGDCPIMDVVDDKEFWRELDHLQILAPNTSQGF